MELGPYAAEVGLTPESLQSGTLTPPDKVKVGLVFEILKYAKRLNVSCLQSARWILSLYRDSRSEHDTAERRRLLDYVRRSASRKYSKREKIRGQKRKEFLDSQFELPTSLPAERENQSPGTEEEHSPAKGKVDSNTIMAKIKGPYSLRRSNQSSLELMMECEEDDLSPWQIEASRRALDDYEKAVQRIKAAKARQMIQQKASSVTTPASLPRSKSPDVIIVGETPATRIPNQVQQSRMGSTQLLKSQLHASQLQHSSLSNSMLTANTLNKNLAGNLSLGKVQGQMRKPGENSSLSQQHSLILPKAISSLLSAANHRQVGSGSSSSNNNNNNSSLSQSDQGTTSANTIGYSLKKTDPLDTASTAMKRTADTDSAQSPPKKKVQRKTSTDSSAGNWVPLDEYYYGKMEGDPNYWEEKGEHRFKCWYCSKMLYNNVRTMMHMQGHIDSEKQQNLDLSDLTQCKHCYKQFDTPFEMQTHIEKVHMNNANVLLCRICEKDHDSRLALTNHMRQVHTACEMPYICQMCNFRSSMYSDAVDHFKKKHDSSPFILCLYCLKIFRVKFVANGWGQTQMYYHHLLKHQSKTNSRKCPICKLTFFNSLEVKAHRKKDHQSNQKGVIGMNAKYTTPDQVMIKVPEPGVAPAKDKSVKSLNAPALTKVMDYHGMKLPEYMETYKCIECKANMNTAGHFRKYIECSMCRFATSCSTAYATHMLGFHSGRLPNFSISIPTEKAMEEPMYCLCGFGSRLGNKIANHMVYCIKKTCYTQKPDVDWVEVDDVDEESNYDDPCRRPGASILDVLGLVKKQTLLPGSGATVKSSDLKPSAQKLEEDSNSSAATNESAGAKESDRSQNAQKQEVPKDTQSTQTPTEAAAESDVDAEFSNWRKVCCEEFELEAENIEKLINRDIAEEWTPEEWGKLQNDCATYGFWFAITDYIYSCEDYTFVKILPRIFENLFLDPPENISNFLSRIRRRLKRGGVDWIKETFMEPQKNLGPLCDKLGITVELLQKGESPNVPASQLSKALALEFLYYKKRHPTMSYADLAGWIKLIFNFPTLPDQRDLHFQLEGIHRLKNKLRGHKTEVVKMLKEPFEPVFTSSDDIDTETDGAATTGSSDDATGGTASCSAGSTGGTGSDSNLTVPATTREEEEEEEDLEEEEEEEEELEEEEEEEFFEDNQDSKSRGSLSDIPPEGSSDDSCSVPALEKKSPESPGSAKDTIPQDDDNTNTSEPSRTQFDKEDSVDSVKLRDSTASESDRKPAGHTRADKLAEDTKSICDTAASETSLPSQTRKRNHSETETESKKEKDKSSTSLDPVTKKHCPQKTEIAKSEATAGLKSGTDTKEAKRTIIDQGTTDGQDEDPTDDLAKESVGIGEKEDKKGERKLTGEKEENPLSSKEGPQDKRKTIEAVTDDAKSAAGESVDSEKSDGVKKSPDVEGRKSKSAEKLQEVCEKLRAARRGGGGGSDANLSVNRKGKKDEDEKIVPDKEKTEAEAGESSKNDTDCFKASESSKELLSDGSGKKAELKMKNTALKTKPSENVPDSKSKVEDSSDTVKPSLKASTATAELKSVEKQSEDEERKSLDKPCDDSRRTSHLKQGPKTPKQTLKEETGKSSESVVVVKSVSDKISKSADSKSSGDSLKVSIPMADTSKSGNDASVSNQSTTSEKPEPTKESNKMSDVQTDSADEKKNLSSKSKLDAETTNEVKQKSEKPKDGENTAQDQMTPKLTETGVRKVGGGVKSADDGLKSKVTTDVKVVEKAKSDHHTDVKKISSEAEKSKESGNSKLGVSLKAGTEKPSEGKLGEDESPKGLCKVSGKKNGQSEDGGLESSKEEIVLKPDIGESSSIGGEKLSSDEKKESAVTKKPESAEDEGKKLEKPNVVSESSKDAFSVKSKESTKDASKRELKESSSAFVSSKTAAAGDGDIGAKKTASEQPVAGEISMKFKEKTSKLDSRESVLTEAGSMQNKTLTKPAAALIKESSSPSEKSIVKPTESASKISSGLQSKPLQKAHPKSALEESLPKSSSLSKKELSEPNQKPSSEAQASSLLKSSTKSSSEAPAKPSLKVPTKTSSEAPAKTSSDAPAKTSSDAPAKTSSVTPAKTSSEVPAKTSSVAPAKTSSVAPAKTSSEAPAKTTSEAPAKTTSEAPAKTTSEATGKTTSETPAKTSSVAPGKPASKVPTKPLSESPAKSPSETPFKKSSSVTPTKSSSETPAKSLSDAPTKSSLETPTKTSSEAKSPSEPQSTNTRPTQTKSSAVDPNKTTAKQAEDGNNKQKKDVHLPTAGTKASAAQDIKKESDNKVTVIKMASATPHSSGDCSSGKGTPKSIASHSSEAKQDSSKSSDTSRSKTTSRAVAEEGRSTKHEGHTSVITPTKKVEIHGFSASTPAESPGTPDKTSSSVSSSLPSLSSSSSQQKKMSSSSSHDDGRRESSGHSYDSRPYQQKSRPEMSHSQHHRDRSTYDSAYRSQSASDRLYHPRDDYGDRKYSSGYDNRNAHGQRGSNQYGGPGPDYRGPNPGQYGGSRDYRGPKSYDQRNRGGGGGGGGGGPPNRGFDPNWRNNRSGGRGSYGGSSGYRGGYRSNYY